MYGFLALMLLVVAVLATQSDVAPIRESPPTSVVGVDAWACPAGTVGRVSCAFVRVPEDYADPEISRIRVFVAVISPPGGGTGVPVAVLGATLGTATVESLGDWQRVARELDRQVVLIDSRGSGSSEPRLSCPELLNSGWLESDLVGAELARGLNQRVDLVGECSRRLSTGIPLAAYTLDAVARDVEAVRSLLGFDRWVLLAGGDVSLVARRNEALFPDRVDRLVLLGAVATEADRYAAPFDRSSEVLSSVLGVELEARLDEVSEPLSDRSVVFPVQVGARTRRVLVSDESIKPSITKALVDDEFRLSIESYIDGRLAEGQWRSVAVLRGRYQPNSTAALPTRLGVLCGLDAETGGRPVDDPGFDTQWTSVLDDLTLDPNVCDTWPVPDRAPVDGEPGVPTLVVNGALDVGAPPSAADQIDTAWSSAAVVVLPDIGRPSPFEGCVIAQVSAFLADVPTSIVECA